MASSDAIFANFVLSLLLRRTVVPTEYHEQVKVVKDMLGRDSTGLVDSLTDFQVNSASVDFKIETKNEELDKTLNKWLTEVINQKYRGRIPTGIKALAEEYYKERWKSSSFPVLKIGAWERVNGIYLPSVLFFVDGESIFSRKRNPKSQKVDIINYDYFLGADRAEKLEKGVILTKPWGRWFDEYPTPYLMKRGVYKNWKIIDNIKNKEIELLDQIIPYLLSIKKGTENLAIKKVKRYKNSELDKIKEDFQKIIDEMEDNPAKRLSPVRVSQFDEEIGHLIPDLKAMFQIELFAQAEKNILGGLGFIDVADAVSTSRRESVLNPKAFIQETKKGVEDFKKIIEELVILIINVNKKEHKKYANLEYTVTASPVKGFISDDFKVLIRSLYDRGLISKQTAVELIGEVDFYTEIKRRKDETDKGLDEDMYAPVIVNQEGRGIDIPGMTPEDETEDDIPDDKKGIEKENFNKSALEGAPYKSIKDLPANVRKSCDITIQRLWMRTFNAVYFSKTYKDKDEGIRETIARQTAWAQVKRMAKKVKGKYTLKSKYAKAMSKLEKASQIKDDPIDILYQLNKLEESELRKELMSKLLNKDKEEENENI
ncbi:MAG: hypothetical protein ACTSPD_09785 [Promethearchaeota archaeon]